MTTLLLGRICRTCLLQSSTMHKLLDSKRASIQIEEMLNITVPNFDLCMELEEDTPLPVEICSECLEKLYFSYRFQQMCLISNEHLRNFFTGEDMKDMALSGTDMHKTSEHLRDNNDNENRLQEVFKIQSNDELMTVSSFGDGNVLEPVKEEPTRNVEYLQDNFGEDKLKEEPVQIDIHENNDIANEVNEMECDPGNDMKDMDLSGIDILKTSEHLRDDNDNENSLQEVFKIEFSDEQITVASFGDGSVLEPVKEKPTRNVECLQDNLDEDKLKEVPVQIDRNENKDFADEFNEMECDKDDVYCPSDDEDKSESKFPKQAKKHKRFAKRARISSNKTCLDCHKVFKRRIFLTRHMSVHSLENQFVCDICQYRFATAKLLTNHNSRKHCDVTVSLEGGPYQCPDCPKIFETTRALGAHKVMHLKRDFNCEICGAHLKTLGAVTRHMKFNHPGVLPYKCEMCEQAFPVETQYNDHMNMHKGYKKYKCEMCDKSFPNTTALKDHVRTHTGESPYLCSHCGKSFKRAYMLRSHLQKHGEKNFQCPKCPMRFYGNATLRQHMTIHSSEKPYVCDICGSSFCRLDSLKTHKLKHSGERPFKCDQCNSSFSRPDSLRTHKFKHSGERSFKCDQCNASFRRLDSLKTHKFKHSGERPFKCDQCNSSFCRPVSLKTHKLKHSGERPFKCDQCNSSFVLKSYLMRHKIRHTGIKPHSCSYCDRAFTRNGDLVKHLRTHVGENTYFCDLCQETFKYQHDLRNHKNQHYNETKHAKK